MNDQETVTGQAGRGFGAAAGSTAPNLMLTPKEELAVICERLKAHINDAKDESVKIRLDVAHDLIRTAIHRR